MRLINLAVLSLMVASFETGHAVASDKSDPLCSTFAGRIVGTKDNTPVVATCPIIKRIEFFLKISVTRSPFEQMVNIVDSTATKSFDDFLAIPNNVAFRQRCKKDFSFGRDESGSYTCLTFGVPFRFFLDPKHRITEMTIVIHMSGDVSQMIRLGIQQLLSNSPTAIIDEPNPDFVQLVWWAEAARFNQLARPGETYRVEDGSFIVDVKNANLEH